MAELVEEFEAVGVAEVGEAHAGVAFEEAA